MRWGSFAWRTTGRAVGPRPGGGGVQGRRVAEPQLIRRAAEAGAQETAAASPATVGGGRLATPRWRRGAYRICQKGVGLRP